MKGSVRASQEAHIAMPSGRPICDMGYSGTQMMAQAQTTCGHRSLSSAQNGARALRRLGHKVKVVRGACPRDSEQP